MAPLKAHGKQDGLWPRCWAGISNLIWFLFAIAGANVLASYPLDWVPQEPIWRQSLHLLF